MVSTTPCCTNRVEALRALLLAALLLFWHGFAAAGSIDVRNPGLQATEEGYVLSADFRIDFNSRLEEAVTKGVALYFVAEFELQRPRWYWMDEKVVSQTQTWRLYYHALTRQYRLSTGTLHQSFGSLDEALRMLSRLRNWLVIEGPLKPGTQYEAALRLRLDISQLPKPFQVSALGSREWNLASDWMEWAFVVPQPPASSTPPEAPPAAPAATAPALPAQEGK